tara:strand:+ start:345 stop:497 length:153 start_codon:yes stop_codon:yes gene_type:complete
MNWQLDIALHWPHDRFALGWEYIGADEKENITTFKVYFFISTIAFHIIGD